MIRNERELVDELHGEAGGGLRTVAVYDREGYDLLYVREDVTSRLEELADEIHDDLVLQGIGNAHLESLFDAGELHCSIHRFDEVTVFHFVAGEYSGLFVSIDSEVDVPLATFAETCKRRLSDAR